MTRLGVIGGHAILGSPWGDAGERRDIVVQDRAAPVRLVDAGTHVVLRRHGAEPYTPAHLVDHVAHMRALRELGCDRVLAVSSVGGLRPELGVGTVLVPDDFIALDTRIAVHEDGRGHIVPAFDPLWRARVVAAATEAVDGVRDGGVYWQSNGPRFETPAEIRLIAAYADVVGMTAASEAIVAQELDVAYAVVSIVDNLANGIAVAPLTNEEFESGKRANRELVLEMLDAIVPVLAE